MKDTEGASEGGSEGAVEILGTRLGCSVAKESKIVSGILGYIYMAKIMSEDFERLPVVKEGAELMEGAAETDGYVTIGKPCK